MAASTTKKGLAVYGDPHDPRTHRLVDRLGLALMPRSREPDCWRLSVTDGQLELVGPSDIHFRLFENEIERRLSGFEHSGLAKACAISRLPRVLDAFGGWGTDGLTLAASGCQVVCCEISPIIATLCRARALNMNLPIHCICDDAFAVMRAAVQEFDVIYLDAMFPAHPKGARPSKALQILAELAVVCDVGQALAEARRIAMDRVVVKRRRNQPSECPPDWSISSKTIRFDVYRALSK